MANPIINPIMSFRLAYLRAIAKAWSDKGFEEKLIHSKNILDSDLPELESLFGNLQLGNIQIQVFDDEASPTYWDTKTTGGWVGRDDFFILNLPAAPEEEQRVEALAAYYQDFPTLFGISPLGQESSENQASAPNIDLGVDPEPFLEFGGVTLRAIALAWDDGNIFNELTDPLLIDATPVLSKYMGYNNPWNFNIQFLKSDEFDWDKKRSQWRKPLPKNTIKLHYPRRPLVSADQQAIALTSYNETGPEYPFTCI